MSKKKAIFQDDFFSRTNTFFDKNSKPIFILGMICAAIVSLLIFDLKMSTMGDDSGYVVRAYQFIHKGSFPTFQGPLYPIIISIPILIFGIHLPTLKLISFLFVMGSLIYFFKAFKNRIPSTILLPTFLLISLNSYLMYYSSQTFSEAMFMFVQAFFFYYFFKHFVENNELSFKNFAILGFVLVVLATTRKVGLVVVVSAVAFLLFEKRWKDAGMTIAGFAAVFAPYNLLKRFVFTDTGSSIGRQENRLFLKDPYKPQQGNEDFMGFIDRFIDNSNLYLSRHLYKFAGLRDDVLSRELIDESLTIFTYGLLVFAFIMVFKKNRYLLFAILYVAIMAGFTFVAIQARWDQDRLILIYYPYILLGVFGGFYYLFKKPALMKLQIVPFLLIILLFLPTFGRTGDKIKDKFPIALRKNINGDIYYGFTPDWTNYLQMCEWVGKNLPKEAKVGARKAGIAFVYSNGKKFTSITRMPKQQDNPDSCLKALADKEIQYIIMANIRLNPVKKTEHTINTIQRYLYYINQKYPGYIKRTVHQIGNDEQATLFEVNTELYKQF